MPTPPKGGYGSGDDGGRLDFQVLTYAATLTPDPDLGSVIQITLTGALNCNANTAKNYRIGQRMTLIFIQDAGAGRVVTFDANFKIAFVPVTTANKINVLEVVWDGTRWVGVASQLSI